MRRFALLLGFALSLLATSAIAQDCDSFTDVPASSPFCPDVSWLVTYSITKGCAPSQFCPNEDVSRLQMAAFMHRLVESGPVFTQSGNAFGSAAFLGTTDNNEFVLVVDDKAAMRVQPAVDSVYGFNPNVINGPYLNTVAVGIAGATIGGGGGCGPGTGGSCASQFGNTVSGEFGTVGGGLGNTAGTAGTVPGGQSNTASGYASFAAGYNANATDNFSFVWSDGSRAADSTGAETFSVLATGGIGLYPGNAQVGILWDSGWSCTVTSGSNWACSSDRHLKENFKTLDLRDVLRRVVAMPVTSWTVIGHPDRRHIGPVAQDFHATFGLGDPKDDTHIDIGDSQGVALAAIQGLNAKVEEQATLLQSRLESQLEEQAATIRDQQRKIAELTERVQNAETVVADVVALRAGLAELQRGRETVAVK